MSNRLQSEKSPYLLQHADNPVDWYPWSEEAFEKARNLDKPIFLSIGYATCHWCHVMAHESFEDEEVARLMNDAFINIKVDREERPDIDNTYMTVCQLLTGHGGWPLTVIMTPDKHPFFAATYIPKESRFNRMGMKDLIPQIKRAWQNEREKVLSSSQKILDGFSKTLKLPEGGGPDEEWIHNARNNLEQQYDNEYGGFGSQPKFPAPHNLTFLLQYSLSYDDEKPLDMVKKTLEQMRFGGIFDHIGFGFHRYSTDRHWLLPHFEKMLYDQATLIIAYAECWKLTGDPLCKQTVNEITDYVAERLTSDNGGFYSAEDADSEGEEGKFYIWSLDEVQTILDPEDSALIADIYNFEPDGNFRDESTREKTGANIPHLLRRTEKLAEERKMDQEELEIKLESIRKKLKKVRAKRIRPIRDDKILTDWNGLMIAALARAGALMNKNDMIVSAEKSWNFISENMIDPEGRLLHRYREGEAAIRGMADDYVFLVWGLIELWEATFNTRYLEHALDLNQQLLEYFFDSRNGGFFFTPADAEKLLGRQKNIYDGAIPSSNSVATMNLLRLARLTGKTKLEEQADETIRAFSSFLEKSPENASHTAEALIRSLKPSLEIVICGDPDDSKTKDMLTAVRLHAKQPYVLLLKSENNKEALAGLAPYTGSFSPAKKPAAYICRQFTCEQPVYNVNQVIESL